MYPIEAGVEQHGANQILPAGQNYEMHLSWKFRSRLCLLGRVTLTAKASGIVALSSTSSRAQLQQYSRVIPETHTQFLVK